MDKYIEPIVEWAVAAVKAQPYVWCAAALTFLIGVQLALAASIAHGDEATVRRQLTSLQRVDVTGDSKTEGKHQLVTVTPVTGCAPVKIDADAHPDGHMAYNNIYMLGLESTETDAQGYTIWKSLTRQEKPDLSKMKSEIWIPKPNASETDPLVKSGGCIIMSFPDPSIPNWLNMIGGYTATPQVAAILPLKLAEEDIKEHKIKMRPFRIDGEDGKGLDLEKLPAVDDVMSRLRLFLGVKDVKGRKGIPQGLTVFKRS